MDRWVGKTALVTGASSGIGAAIALALAEQGMNVVGVARTIEKLQEVVKQLKENAKGELFPLQADISKEDNIYKVVAAVKEKYGGVDVLVNNAAIFKVGKILDHSERSKIDDAYVNSLIDTNIKSPVILSRECAKSMMERGTGGHIINICSTTGHTVLSTAHIYSASKFFIKAFSETIRQEVAQSKSNIKITNLSPGLVRTPMSENVIKSLEANQGEVPVIGPEDITPAVIYVLSTPPHVNVSELKILAIGEIFG